MLYINDLIEKCSKEGITITKMGLYIAGEKEGFIFKDEKGKYDLDKDKFISWLDKHKEKAPEGWLNIIELSEMLNKPVSSCYSFIKQNEIEVKRIGIRNVMYVERKAVEELIKNGGKKHKYRWEEN